MIMADGNDRSIDNFVQEIKNALVNLKTLKIVTAVGAATWNAQTRSYEPTPGADVKVIQTTIDLLDGDMETLMDPAFVSGDLQSLREFHAQTERQGHEIVQKNLDAVKALFNLALHLQKGG
jgi:hypothetical protein